MSIWRHLFLSFGIFCGIVYFGQAIPLLWQDLTYSDFEPAVDHRIEHASCQRIALVISLCSATVRSSGGQKVELSYASFGSWGGETTYVLRSKSDPTKLTTPQGLDHRLSRTLFLLFLGSFGTLALTGALRGSKAEPAAAFSQIPKASTVPSPTGLHAQSVAGRTRQPAFGKRNC